MYREKNRLPHFLKPLFWEYNFEKLNLKEDKDLIIQRLLQFGDLKAIKWLLKEVGHQEVKNWIKKNKGKGLSPRQLYFWMMYFKLSPDELSSEEEKLK